MSVEGDAPPLSCPKRSVDWFYGTMKPDAPAGAIINSYYHQEDADRGDMYGRDGYIKDEAVARGLWRGAIESVLSASRETKT